MDGDQMSRQKKWNDVTRISASISKYISRFWDAKEFVLKRDLRQGKKEIYHKLPLLIMQDKN